MYRPKAGYNYYMYKCTYCKYTCTHVCTYCKYTSSHVCTYVCMYIHMYLHSVKHVSSVMDDDEIGVCLLHGRALVVSVLLMLTFKLIKQTVIIGSREATVWKYSGTCTYCAYVHRQYSQYTVNMHTQYKQNIQYIQYTQ